MAKSPNGQINEQMVNGQMVNVFGGLAQLARAPALQAGGQRFESVILHCPEPKWLNNQMTK